MEQSWNHRPDEQQTIKKSEDTQMRLFRVVVNGTQYEVGIEELQQSTVSQSAPAYTPQPQTPNAPAAPRPTPQEAPRKSTAPAASGAITAPMPGTILRVEIAPGDTVSKGQTLLVLEAMKMENEILAPQDGTIKELNASKGQSVNAGDVLVVIGS
jgi:biotin carboxyl carrier protein